MNSKKQLKKPNRRKKLTTLALDLRFRRALKAEAEAERVSQDTILERAILRNAALGLFYRGFMRG